MSITSSKIYRRLYMAVKSLPVILPSKADHNTGIGAMNPSLSFVRDSNGIHVPSNHSSLTVRRGLQSLSPTRRHGISGSHHWSRFFQTRWDSPSSLTVDLQLLCPVREDAMERRVVLPAAKSWRKLKADQWQRAVEGLKKLQATGD